MDFTGGPVSPPHLDNLIKSDGYLTPYRGAFEYRYGIFEHTRERIAKEMGGYEAFTKSYKEYGLIARADGSITSLEWAPKADALYLIGDFNKWDRRSHPFTRGDFGKWTLSIPPLADGSPAIAHMSIVKVLVAKDGKEMDKLSPWASLVDCAKDSTTFHHVFYNPPHPYVFENAPPTKAPRAMRIYECHVGISSAEPKIASYRHFADHVLPHIHRQGYNCVQLMAVMEHAYYASFGYQVTSFFASSSRCGPPHDLKYLVDKAHGLGIYMLLDIVHSHASKNTEDGLNQFDGTDGCYFHDNARGDHGQWGSRLFNYTETEVLRFLLSNLRMWIEEYSFDGFRFDGVTSMLYHHHGIGGGFDSYDDYFGDAVDIDSVIYLMLANDMVHTLYGDRVFTIAEDVSGMPGLCRSVSEGGIGFDARLMMAIPDMWIKILKHTADEDWNISNISHTRYGERAIAYAESHDQALVGDKTLAFWLMDAEMYTNMSTSSPLTPVIERGIAVHKLIRFVTHALGGDGWLNFIGNEFGHPEWLDFPRAGNEESFHYARRQFNLIADDGLRYKFLNAWDVAMNHAEEKYKWLSADPGHVSLKHESDKVLSFERGGCLFVFNFHPTKSFADYKIGVNVPGEYTLVLNSDDAEFGGHCRLTNGAKHLTFPEEFCHRRHHLCVYLPARTAIMLAIV